MTTPPAPTCTVCSLPRKQLAKVDALVTTGVGYRQLLALLRELGTGIGERVAVRHLRHARQEPGEMADVEAPINAAVDKAAEVADLAGWMAVRGIEAPPGMVAGTIEMRSGDPEKPERHWLRVKPEGLPAAESIDVEALRASVRRWKPARRTLGTVLGEPSTLLVNWADWQLGKSEGGGVAATVERIERSFEATQRRLRELRRIGRNVEGITIANMGDPVEGCMGNYASQLFTVELNQREQIELSLDLWTAGARLLLPLAERASFVSVTCNHGELGRGGSNRNQTSESDNIGGLLPGLLRRVLGDHEAFADVSWHIPHDEPVTTADLSGVPVAFTHGHKGGSNFEKWVDDQSRELVYRRKFTPRLWIAAHRHHLRMADLGPYTLAQCPSLDGGSQWLTNLNGRWSTPGTLTMLVGQHDVRGYSDVAVL